MTMKIPKAAFGFTEVHRLNKGPDDAMPEKEQLIPASEFGKICRIPVSTLKYYDEIDLFKPYRRADNGYRYYSPHQIIAMSFIRVLTELGVPLSQISELESSRTPSGMLRTLHQQELELDRKLEVLRANYSVLHVHQDLIFTGMTADENAVTVEELPALPIRMGTRTNFGPDEHFYGEFARYLTSTSDNSLVYPVGGYFDSMERYLEVSDRPSLFFSVDPSGSDERPAGRYLTGYARGYYGEPGDIAKRLALYAADHNLVCKGPVYNIFLHDEICEKDPNHYLMQATVQVKQGGIS